MLLGPRGHQSTLLSPERAWGMWSPCLALQIGVPSQPGSRDQDVGSLEDRRVSLITRRLPT